MMTFLLVAACICAIVTDWRAAWRFIRRWAGFVLFLLVAILIGMGMGAQVGGLKW
jgi:hypothetical protein